MGKRSLNWNSVLPRASTGRKTGQPSTSSAIGIANFDREAARVYGQVRVTLERQGTPIGSLDTVIGAHALALGVTLATNNILEFSRIEGLTVVNWLDSGD